jgi:hypothetical protein
MNAAVIRVEHLSNSDQSGAISHGALTTDLPGWWPRARGNRLTEPARFIENLRNSH